MSWKQLFNRFGHKEPKPLVRNFDRRLINNLRSNFWPSLNQLKYLKRFLSKAEKNIIKISCGIIVLTILFWGGWIIASHHTVIPKNGGEYSEALIGQPKLINPIFAGANDVDSDIVPLLYSGLFRFNKDQKLIPELAASWSVSSDQKTYTIKLRQDIAWTDEKKLIADDVIFTLETIQNPEVNSPLFTSFQGIAATKINDYEIQFVLKEPFVSFLNSLTLGIIPEHIWGEILPANLRLAKENLQPKVTSGPWKFLRLVKDGSNIQTYALEKNNKYFGNLPYLQNITFKFYQDYAEATDALRAKELTAVSFVPRHLQDKISSKNLIIYNLHLPQYTALFFNQTQQSILKDLSFRKNLIQAIDKKLLVAEALNNNANVTDSPFLPGSIGYYPEIKKIEYDLEAVNQSLDKAEWKKIDPETYFKIRRDILFKSRLNEIKSLPEFAANSSTLTAELQEKVDNTVRQEMWPDQTFYRQDKKGNLLSLTITTTDMPEYQKVADSVARMWRASGIQTNIQTVAGRQISRDILKTRNYEILLYGEILGDDPDPYPFWHSSQTNYPGLNLSMMADRNADKILEEARSTNDLQKRIQLYKQFQDILAKELPAIFLYTPTYNFVADKNLQGVKLDKIFVPSDRFNGLSEWYIKTKWEWN
ncbi:MAG: hypothetical protein COU29_01150 [Candidatus Magasanikbacteria bacterium CG10_big_fil_rev_8_21_14_0_10_36_32]|uniref:Solute-binding protein family 5 domain-containing protein n=1 Tax=Candidatus Magasanikbacteria bacterium CG10_big_fil_rev_8_21_14_0_10_36_32 TaxID=1974646 RepID=A0A2M6W6I6_9BACT|nr:MAG: hypothetical protein COU29_01150 [Candidatus Magasanikbacteria bacterium CG10_big_fil_rev_8_21_14_0_10_36_32]